MPNSTITADSGSYSITGHDRAFLVATPMATGDYNITGTAVTLRFGFSLTALPGTYSIAGGPPVKLILPKRLAVTSGSYDITGGNTVLVYSNATGKVINIEDGVYTVTGQTADLRADRVIQADSGTYDVTGSPISLNRQLESGAYVITGTSVTLHIDRKLIADSGSYIITGSTAALRGPGPHIQAQGGVYNLFGFQVNLHADRILVCDPGAYSISAPDVFLRATRITAEPGAYSITGFPATLKASHKGRWRGHPKQPSITVRQPAEPSSWDKQDPSEMPQT